MSNPENLARKFGQTITKRHIEILQHASAECVGIMPIWQQNCGQCARIILWLLTQNLKAPCLHRFARCGGMPVMPFKHIIQPFFMQHIDRFGQAVKKIGCRGERKCAILICRNLFFPIPIAAAHTAFAGNGQCLFRHRIKRKSRWQHQAFLRSSDRYINAPFIMPKINRAKRRDCVSKQKRIMTGIIHRRANFIDA